MTDVTIRKCTLRIIRRGGWSWGADRRELAEAVVRRLAELIAEQLAGLWPDDVDGHVRSPVQVRVPIPFEVFMRAVRSHERLGRLAPSDAARELRARLRHALATSLQPHCADESTRRRDVARRRKVDPVRRGAERPKPISTTPAIESLATRADEPLLEAGGIDAPSLAPIVRLLLDWHRNGELPRRLRGIPPRTLRLWHDRVLGARRPRSAPAARDGPARPPAARPALDRIANVVREIAASMDLARAPLVVQERVRLVAAITVLDRLGITPDERRVIATVDEIIPPRPLALETPTEATAIPRSSTVAPPESPITSLPVRATPADPLAPALGEITVHSALPFIVAGALARFGWIDAASATLDALGIHHAWPAAAAALAYKMLDAPERGWRRGVRSLRSAAAFAGVREVPDERLIALARQLDDHTAPMNGTVTEAVLGGRDASIPLMLATVDEREPRGLMLIDVEGWFPVAWADTLADLRPILESCENTILLVSSAAATPERLAAFHEQGMRFIAPGLPTRHESWRVCRATSGATWITNDARLSRGRLLDHARRAPAEGSGFDRLVTELIVRRPCTPPRPDHHLDRAMTLAAGLGLGDVARRLWCEREPTDPTLALERFGDLSARITFGPDTVQVRLPIGQRSADLDAAGFLRPVARVPWLDDRTLVFGQG